MRACLSGRRGCFASFVHTLILVGVFGAAEVAARAETVTGDLDIYVLNVGQGDAILVRCPHSRHFLLIDAGAHSYPGSHDAFRQQVLQLVDAGAALQVLVATHPHEDHVGGIQWALETFRVGKFIDSGKPYTPTFAGIDTTRKRLVRAARLKYYAAINRPASRIADFCPASNVLAEILIPEGYGKAANPNNNSVVIAVTYNRQKFIFTGDAEKAEEKLLLADPQTAAKVRGSLFYKVGHHGSETSSTPAFLDAMQPSVAAVSSGCKNVAKNKTHRHPRAVVLRSLLSNIEGGTGRDMRVVNAGGPKGWTMVGLHQGIYVTSIDSSIVVHADGTATPVATSANLTGAPGPCQ